MSRAGLVLGRPDGDRLSSILATAESSALSYAHVGSTLSTPSGDRMPLCNETVLGHGTSDFRAAVTGLRRWACHDGLHARVHPVDAPLEPGTTLLVVLPVGPASIVVPNRIVGVVDEPNRFGFAYGTLHGHQERGEECFVAEMDADGTVRGRVCVDAVAASVVARAGGPLLRRVQHIAADRYLAAWRRSVSEARA